MKKSIPVLFSILALAFGLTSMTSNNAEYSAGKAGSNGSPGEGTCASGSCHNSFTLNSGPGSVSISVAGLVNGNLYTPGQTYQVSVTVQQQGFGLFGFGIEALQTTGANAGSWTPGADSHILSASVSGNTRATVTHIDNSGFSSDMRTWTFSWTAPATEIPVTMYAAGNAANANGGDLGDYIYTTTLSLQPAPAIEAPIVEASGDLTICEGESVVLSVSNNSGLSYVWQDESGNVIETGSSYVATETGCYSVSGSDGTQTATSELTCVEVQVVNSNFSGLAPMYCIGDAPIELFPEVPGGFFSGPGVVGNVFSPSNMPVGDFLIGYTVITSAGCEFTQTEPVSIRAILPAGFTDLDDVYCTTDAAINLDVETQGGVFTGPVVAGNFSPDIEPGIYDITYTTGSGVCTASTTQTVQILPSQSSDFYLFPAFCASSPAEQMVPDVVGGVFSGTGVNDEMFDPSQANLGDNEVTYTLVQPNGCVSTTTQVIAVFDVANSEFSGLDSITCTTEGAVALVPVSVGGEFSGPGVSGSSFDPLVAGVGEHTIIYDINLGDCQSETAITTIVIEGPDASFTGLSSLYCEDADVPSELVSENISAVFDGPGVEGNSFNAALAGAGTHTISCTYTDANGCTATTTQTAIVNPLPIVEVSSVWFATAVAVPQEGATYQWWNCDTQEQVDGATSSEFSITNVAQNGSFSVEVTLNGCDAMSDCVMLLMGSVDEILGEWSSGFYPNPVSTNLNVWSTIPVGFDIFNGIGTIVYSNPSNAMNHSLDVSALPSGIYRLVMQHEGQIRVSNLLIKR